MRERMKTAGTRKAKKAIVAAVLAIITIVSSFLPVYAQGLNNIENNLPYGYSEEGGTIDFEYAWNRLLRGGSASTGDFEPWDYDPQYGTGPIYYQINGERYLSYCMEMKLDPPFGEVFTEHPLANDGVRAIMYHGHPMNLSGLKERLGLQHLSDKQLGTRTFVAINAFLNGQHNADRALVESKGDLYVNELLKYADKGQPQLDVKINRTSVNSIYNNTKNRLESSDFLQVTANVDTFNRTYDLNNLASGVYAVDENGNKITNIQYGKKFKLATDNLRYNGILTVNVNHDIKNPAAIVLRTTNPRIQQLVTVKGFDPLKKIEFKQTFTPAVGNLVIEKTSDDGIVDGLTFRVTGQGYDQTKTTANGKAEFKDLLVGQYNIEEVGTPARYKDFVAKSADVQAGKTVTFKAHNENWVVVPEVNKITDWENYSEYDQEGNLLEEKTQDFENVLQADGTVTTPSSRQNVVIELAKVDEQGQISEVIGERITDENGRVEFDGQFHGKYAYRETSVPVHMKLDDTWKHFTIDQKGGTIQLELFNNLYRNKVKVLKTNDVYEELIAEKLDKFINSGLSPEQIAAEEARLRNNNDNPYPAINTKYGVFPINPITKEVLTENPVCMLSLDHEEQSGYSSDLTVGHWQLREYVNDIYFADVVEPINFELTHDDMAEVKEILFTNLINRANLRVYKVDEETKEPLEGATFALYADKKGKQILSVKTTNEKGELVFEDLINGTYYVGEVVSPTDYTLKHGLQEFVVDRQNHGKTITYEFENHKKPVVKVSGMGTTATGENGEKVLDPRVENILHDTITYWDFPTGEKIEFVAEIVRTGTYEVLLEKVFADVILEEETGQYRVEVTLPANTLKKGDSITFFEQAYKFGDEGQKIKITEERNPFNEGQTVIFDYDEPEKPTPQEPEQPMTGDKNDIISLVALLGLALGAIFLVFTEKKRQTKGVQ